MATEREESPRLGLEGFHTFEGPKVGSSKAHSRLAGTKVAVRYHRGSKAAAGSGILGKSAGVVAWGARGDAVAVGGAA